MEENDANLMQPGRAFVPQGSKVEQLKHGGEGSGNFGHAGRPGEVGGSGEGGGGNAEKQSAARKEGFAYYEHQGDTYRTSDNTKLSKKDAYILGHTDLYGDTPDVRKMASDRYDFKQLPKEEQSRRADKAMDDYMKEFGE
jgi:hypothetical protein